MNQQVRAFLAETQTVVAGIDALSEQIAALADALQRVLRHGGKVLVFGNGGSAADAQHLAAELVGRFERDRRALPALALSTDTSALTAIGNDFGFDQVFARQIEALASPGDAVIAISTSGNSENIVRGAQAARAMGCFVAGLTGRSGGRLVGAVDLCILVDSSRTAAVQVAHSVVLHAVCHLVERGCGDA